MPDIRPFNLPAATVIPDNAAVMIDTGTAVEKATPLQVVDVGVPLASQALAEAGADNDTRMSPLRTKQAIDTQVPAFVASRATTNLNNVTYDGSLTPISTPVGAVQGAYVGENIVATNASVNGQYSIRFAALNKTGRLTGGQNDIGDTLITRHSDIGNGYVWGRWDVVQSPLAVGSGLAGAPTLAQSFAIVKGEINPQNRHGNTGWEAENRRFNNWVGGEQWVPETQDFSSLLGNNRVGYHIAFARSAAKSPYASNFGTMAGRHARFYNLDLINPNAIVGGGYGYFATGWKTFPTAVTISAAGSGYAVGNLLEFNTGLSQSLNQNTVVRVATVNGSGGVTGIEIWEAGWYQQSFASPVGVTGGSGTGATFTYTMSTASEIPQGLIGIAGFWEAALNGCPRPGAASNTGQAAFQRGMVICPNNNNIIVSRDAADTVDVVGLKLNAANRWELGEEEIVPWTAYTPTFSAQTGTLGGVDNVVARWSAINGTVTVRVSFRIVTIGTAVGNVRVSLPVNTHTSGYQSGSGAIISLGRALGVGINLPGAANLAVLSNYDGTFPGANDTYYAITATYEAV